MGLRGGPGLGVCEEAVSARPAERQERRTAGACEAHIAPQAPASACPEIQRLDGRHSEAALVAKWRCQSIHVSFPEAETVVVALQLNSM